MSGWRVRGVARALSRRVTRIRVAATPWARQADLGRHGPSGRRPHDPGNGQSARGTAPSQAARHSGGGDAMA